LMKKRLRAAARSRAKTRRDYEGDK
jgi:hypothetical protein